jgi:hypothetical protein
VQVTTTFSPVPRFRTEVRTGRVNIPTKTGIDILSLLNRFATPMHRPPKTLADEPVTKQDFFNFSVAADRSTQSIVYIGVVQNLGR